jgi:AcrR family transcriptional regulator
MKAKRTYTMGARSEAVLQTRRRILTAVFDLSQARRIADISLSDVAAEAEVSVQTVLRQFGSRDGLLDATAGFASEVYAEERATPVGDIDSAVRVIVEHYELRAPTALLLLSQEEDPRVGPIVAHAKLLHRKWVRAAFAPFIDDASTEDLLVVATDVYTWKLLRRDAGHTRDQTEQRINRLVRAVLAERIDGSS